jgi:hypothetical protein
VNVANVKISSSNVASFQLGIGIGIGNISTMATFTSVGVGEWSVELESGIGDLRILCGKSETAITCHLARI